MENLVITNHSELALQILHLKEESSKEEEVIKDAFKEVVDKLSPVAFVKESIHQIARDEQTQQDLSMVGLKIGANVVIDKIFGKNKSIKGFLSSVLAESIANSFINNLFNVQQKYENEND